NMRSTWLREAILGRTVKPPPDENFSRIDITSIKLIPPSAPAGSPSAPTPIDLTGSKHFIAPDDRNADDQTVMAVPLPQPIGPVGTATVEVKWTAHVPRTFARTGVIGNFYFIAQWFPKLGVLQEDGWNCHQFHSSTEFFSDYGVYDVNLR